MAKWIALTQRVEDLPERGERRDCLDQAWSQLVTELGFLPIAIPNRIQDPEGFLEELDLAGVILTGGNDLAQLPGATNTAPERDRLEAAVVAHCAQERIPLLGVCRGMQLLATLAGATLERVSDHVAVEHPLRLEQASRLALSEGQRVNSFHQWGLRAETLDSNWIAVATAADGSLEAMEHRQLPQWGIMWHPERPPSGEPARRLLKNLFLERM